MEYPKELKPALFSSRFMGAALAVSLLIYFVFEEIMRSRHRPFFGFARLKNPTTIRYGFFAAAIVIVIINRFLNGRLLKTRTLDDAQKGVRILFRAAVISLVLSEIPALIGLALFLTAGLYKDFYLLFFVSLVLIFMYYPRRKSWEDYLQNQPLSCRLSVKK